MDAFKERLKDLREEKELSQRELAKKLAIGHTSIARWERGDVEPNASSIIMLALFFDVTAGYLLGLEN